MIHYKNILLNISNGLNSCQVSTAHNVNAETDALFLAHTCRYVKKVVARNGKEYFYFVDSYDDPRMIQYLLNRNGVLAYRRYSAYQVYYGTPREVVRVPVKYVAAHPNAKTFIDKIIDAQKNTFNVAGLDLTPYAAAVKERMKRQK